jgi:hypothetical protein
VGRFSSHVKERPSRLFLVDPKRDRVRQIDHSYDGSPRTSEGVGRYNIAFDLPSPDISPDGRFVSAFSKWVNNRRSFYKRDKLLAQPLKPTC